MNSYTHMVVGGLTGGALVAVGIAQTKMGIDVNAHTVYPIISVLPAVYGAIGPDIDMPHSKSGRKVRKALIFSIFGAGASLAVAFVFALLTGGTLGDLLFPFVVFALSCFLFVFIKTSKHRGKTHSGLLWIIMLIPLAWYLFFGKVSLVSNIILSVYVGFVVGWLSHLVADTFNKKGVPWLYPFSHKKYHIAAVLTGSYEESVFRIASIVVFIAFYVVIVMFGR